MPIPAPSSRRSVALHLALAALCALAATLVLGLAAPSRDLMALWLAAQEVAAGTPDRIYAPLEPLFTMRPAMDWYARAEALGRPGQVYPYLYPPLWAHLLAPLTGQIGFVPFAAAVLGVQAGLLALMPMLALRLAGLVAPPARAQILFWIGAMAALILSHGVPIALTQGQPQITVAFLTLFALERAAGGRPLSAGLCMGLAIALKLTPLPLALLWLATGQGRAAGIALTTAAALALASVACAGWQVHELFLAHLQAINATAISSMAVASFDQLWGSLCCSDLAQRIPDLPPEIGPSHSGWFILPKTALWAGVQKLAIVTALAGFGWALHRKSDPLPRALLWGAAIATLAFLGPIGWLYYYLVSLVLLPLTLRALGPRGLILPGLVLLLINLGRGPALPGWLSPFAHVSTSLAMLVMIATFLWAAFRPLRQNRIPPMQ